MLRPTELRIGNYVNHYNWRKLASKLSPSIGRISGISKNGFTINSHWSNEAEGIPLTPEILLLCGFQPAEESPGEGWYEIPIYRDNLQVAPNLEYPMVCIKDEHDTNVILDKVTIYRYLHQIQNLYFALTGMELPITFPTETP